MEFTRLRTIVDKSRRLSHIDQPVMLMTLLEKGGRASVRDIATREPDRDAYYWPTGEQSKNSSTSPGLTCSGASERSVPNCERNALSVAEDHGFWSIAFFDRDRIGRLRPGPSENCYGGRNPKGGLPFAV